ncbi:hypothetical protein GNI_073050 [Gregarina niphandrodes]|uniref:Uncharacterized protein n=1 Tax=Gregarina niphandrodes TaxID=110365 RepID=A0A023B776_GRENI|nr:hypothetical protein GNI_073050 [Gregarina niphandrodes]EZG66997.1 hypothetical protein GNI_073050 [Gregarina niphandrodes]|eukprot:XP_011130384.1 hypothetical protein GNI_073050 [Gregarina niphandrodes]
MGFEPCSDTHRAEAVYVRSYSTLASLAEGVVESAPVANKKLHELLSMEEWRRVKSITREDLENCQLAYLELGAIISMFLSDPFGDVTLETKAWLGPILGNQKVTLSGSQKGQLLWRHCDSNWVTGCFLQRSDVPTDKLVNFCVDTLHYMPVVRNVILECLKPTPRPRNYRNRKSVAGAREILMRIMAGLSTSSLGAERFGKLIVSTPATKKSFFPSIDVTTLPSTSPRLFLDRPIRSVSWTKVKDDSMSRHTVYRRTQASFSRYAKSQDPKTSVFPQDDVELKLDNLLDGDWTSLNGLKGEDVLKSTLAYFELGTIIEKYILGAFGSVCSSMLQKVATAMHDGRRSLPVRGWIAGCILRYSKVPIYNLIQFCVRDLSYKPPERPILECLRFKSNTTFRTIEDGRHEEYCASMIARLSGLSDIVSIPEWIALTSDKERLLRYIVQQTLPSSEPPSSEPPTVPSKEAKRTTQAKRTTETEEGCLSYKRRKPYAHVTSTTEEGGFMYCHPNDLIEFLDWVESGMCEHPARMPCSS